jgi:hypothetical protein
MSNEKPMTAWQECKAISEDLVPAPEPPEQTEQRLRATLLAQLAALGEKGAALASRLATADGPVSISTEDMPDELRQLFHR